MVGGIVEDGMIFDQLDNDLKDIWQDPEHVLKAVMLRRIFHVLTDDIKRSGGARNRFMGVKISSGLDDMKNLKISL